MTGMARKGTALALVCLLAAGCTRLEDNHGFAPDDDILSDVVVGLDTKDTVARIVGQPGARGVIGDDAWYYVESDYERFLWREPVEVSREVVKVSFAQDNRVTNIERFGLEDGRIIALSRRVTDSNTEGVGFLRQLFSNLGNLGAGQLLGEN